MRNLSAIFGGDPVISDPTDSREKTWRNDLHQVRSMCSNLPKKGGGGGSRPAAGKVAEPRAPGERAVPRKGEDGAAGEAARPRAFPAASETGKGGEPATGAVPPRKEKVVCMTTEDIRDELGALNLETDGGRQELSARLNEARKRATTGGAGERGAPAAASQKAVLAYEEKVQGNLAYKKPPPRKALQ